MTVSRNNVQVTWSAANTISVSSGATQTSDAIAFSAAAFAAMLMVKADNAGTPASGDVITVKIVYTTGDPDAEADSADEYGSTLHATVLFTLDTNTEDPAIRSYPIPIAKGCKIILVSGAASNSITCSAQITEILA